MDSERAAGDSGRGGEDGAVERRMNEMGICMEHLDCLGAGAAVGAGGVISVLRCGAEFARVAA